MKKDLKVTLIQAPLSWENRTDNLAYFSEKFKTLDSNIDVVVLPEMFTTAFSMNATLLAEDFSAQSITGQWMIKWANTLNVLLIGSVITKKEGHFYNSMVAVFPDGNFEVYNKRHLFRFAGEDKVFTAGDNRLIISWKGWRICPLICYDLRFPAFSRNIPLTIDQNIGFIPNRSDSTAYDCLIYVANWPEVRSNVWKTLLIARAIENQVYVVGVNRIGSDGNGFVYSGDSAVINPKGEQMSATKSNQENQETVLLSCVELTDFRNKFPVSLDADCFEFNNRKV